MKSTLPPNPKRKKNCLSNTIELILTKALPAVFVIRTDSGNHQKSNISTERRDPHQRSTKKTANWNSLNLWKNKQRNRHNRNTNPRINQPKPRKPKFILFQSALPSFQILQDSNFLLISLIPDQKLPRIVIFLLNLTSSILSQRKKKSNLNRIQSKSSDYIQNQKLQTPVLNLWSSKTPKIIQLAQIFKSGSNHKQMR